MAQTRAGIQFIENDLKEAIRQARAEQKLIFVDGYADWCVPCKLMDEEVFIHPNVYNYFNDNFINLKIDLEAGIGPILSARYNAHTLPFYMFLSDDETLVHSVHGFQRIHQILGEGKRALEPGRLRTAWDARYAEGDRKPSFLYNYAFEIYPSADGFHHKVVDEYLASGPDMTTDRNVRFVWHFVEKVDSDLFRFMAENQHRFFEVLGKDEVQQTIDLMVEDAISNSQPPLSIEEIADLYVLAYPIHGKRKALEYKLSKYDKDADSERYTNTLLEYYQLVPPSDEELMETIAYLKSTDKQGQYTELISSWLTELANRRNDYHILDAKAEWDLSQGDFGGALSTYESALVKAKKSKDKARKKHYKARRKEIKKRLRKA